jgi:hypothetical protein
MVLISIINTIPEYDISSTDETVCIFSFFLFFKYHHLPLCANIHIYQLSIFNSNSSQEKDDTEYQKVKEKSDANYQEVKNENDDYSRREFIL